MKMTKEKAVIGISIYDYELIRFDCSLRTASNIISDSMKSRNDKLIVNKSGGTASEKRAGRHLLSSHSRAFSCLIPLCDVGGSTSSVSRYFGL